MHANNAGIQYKCIQTVQPASSLKQSHKVKHPRSIPKQSRKPPRTLDTPGPKSLKKYTQTVLEHNGNARRKCWNTVAMYAEKY